MKSKIYFYFTITLILIKQTILCQNINVPMNNSIYDFCERINIKGIVNYSDEVRPLSRNYFANLLIELKDKTKKLNDLEKDELNFYLDEYNIEIEKIKKDSIYSFKKFKYISFDNSKIFRFFSYKDSFFTLNIEPIIGFKFDYFNKQINIHRWNGLRGWGYLSDNFSFSFDFRDNLEKGNFIDKTKEFSPQTGINPMLKSNESIEYSEVRGSIGYKWSWGEIQFGKDFINIGSSRNSQIILSSKAPSFPYVKLFVQPVNWLRFTYIYAWLHSGIIDSNTIRRTSVEGRDSYLEIDKYLVLHNISFDINEKLSFSIGESVVSSEKQKPIYFIPVLFFRLADHYLMKENSNSGDNAQIFSNIVYIIPKIRTKIYGTIFIDELSITRLIKGERLASIAYSLGLKFVDPVWKNSDITLEYTRINPFVYMNSNNAETYYSHGYQLGHWIGSNADQFFVEIKQKLLRGLLLKFSYQMIRKGQKELPKQQYEFPYPKTLFGTLRKDLLLELSLSYELFGNFYVIPSFLYSKISDEEKNRTSSYLIGQKTRFSLSISYGI